MPAFCAQAAKLVSFGSGKMSGLLSMPPGNEAAAPPSRLIARMSR